MRTCDLASGVEEQLLERNPVFENFFAREAHALALACREMSERFLDGGRLLAFGRGPYATDAQHVSVEFVHPIIVGKRALPALDLSIAFQPWLSALLQPRDIVMGFGPPEGDPEVQQALDSARDRQAMTFALPGSRSACGAGWRPAAGGQPAPPGAIANRAQFNNLPHCYSLTEPCSDPFLHQEMIEILYHTLWETVHVFFERRELGHDVGPAAFLYPFLGEDKQDSGDVVEQVAASIQAKAREDAKLRAQVAREESEHLAGAALAIGDRLARGAKLLLFGNGGSATDANDWALDCVAPPSGFRPIPAVSLSMEPANITAVANDVGAELIFQRQLIAHSRPGDIAVAISTSGGSRNIIIALEEARKRNLLTVALLGYDGGEILRRGLADFPLVVRSDYIPRIQEVQSSMYHVLRRALETLARA